MKNYIISTIVFISLIFCISKISHSQQFWNQAAYFNGILDTSIYVSTPNSASLNIIGSFTIEMWINPVAQYGNDATLMWKGGAQYGFEYYYWGAVSLFSRNYNRLFTKKSTVIPLNQWTHVSGVYDKPSNKFSLYVNGVFDTSSTILNASPQSDTGPLIIGKNQYYTYDGYMDDVRIWNRALSASEIASMNYISVGAPGTGVYNGLVLSYTFQNRSSQGSTFSLFDWSRNGNNGTAHNISSIDLSNKPSHTQSYNTALSTGPGSWFAVPNSTSINISGSFTAEAWVFTTIPASGHYSPVISKYKSASLQGYSLGISSYGTILPVINGTGVAGSTVLPPNQWNHIAMSVTAGGLASLYLNGNLDFTFNFGSAPISHSDSLFIGARDYKDYFLNGLIDEVRISNYAKTQQQINDGMFVSIDQVNDPNAFGTDAVFNFDGNSTTSCDANIFGYFRGGAKFTTATKIAGVYYPQSPLFREDNDYFPAGWFLKPSNRRIPQTGTAGNMVDDSLYVSDTHTINDLNFFIALNHTYTQDLSIYLIDPLSDTLKVYNQNYTIGRDNLVTIFDDQADSSMTSPFTVSYVTFSPVIKPANSLNAKFSGKSPTGIWKLHIVDNDGGDTGIVYNWGIQINNESVKGSMGKPKANNISPYKFALMQNYPNPFNPSTSIKFTVPASGIVTLKVYDLLGQEVAVLVNEKLEAGEYSRTFDASVFASGVYFYKLESGDFVDTKKMMLIK